MPLRNKIFISLFSILFLGCETAEKNASKDLHFDDSNYRRELKFSVNGQEINGYGTAKKSPFGYTVEAKVSDEIFRGFIRSCNGTKKLELQEKRWKGYKTFKTFIPLLDKPFHTPCLIEIFLFSGDGLHKFGMFDTKGDEKLRFKSSCNYDYGERIGSDFCHSSAGDYYFIDSKGKSVKFFHAEDCPEPLELEPSKWQILVTKKACAYVMAHKLFNEKARLTVIGWNDIFMREVF